MHDIISTCTFTRIVDIAESISGSESEETDEEDQEQQEEDGVKDLVARQQAQVEASAMMNDQQSNTVLSSFEKKTQALAWFQANSLSPSVHFGIYRRLADSLDGLKQLQNQKSRLWTIIMVGGGHFAAGVVDVNKSLQYGQQYGGLDVNQVKMVAHKTFHRYTSKLM